MADMIVAGAGSTEYNGTYVESGTYGGKPYYEYNNGEYVVTMRWGWSDPPDDFAWLILRVPGSARYYSSNDVATPDLCTVWRKGLGNLPVPTVTAAGGGDPSGALRRTNMNAQMQSLTGGFN